jgi:DNA-binding CsgD family transcriptional regulator
MRPLIIDDPTRRAIARLTENEKQCLRRRLQHQTAKEMAIELGISPHAVEKRLKMARTKTGLSSSLEAARMLDALEKGYGRTLPHGPVLENEPAGKQRAEGADPPFETGRVLRRNVPLVSGVFLMSLFVTAVAIALQSSAPSGVRATADPAAPVARSQRPVIMEHFNPSEMVKATPAEIAMMIQSTFSAIDKNADGYIEADEAPVEAPVPGTDEIEQPMFVKDKRGNVKPTGIRRISIEQARAEYIAAADTNHDGRLDFAEFRIWMTPIIATHGIPAKWRADIDRSYGH